MYFLFYKFSFLFTDDSASVVRERRGLVAYAGARNASHDQSGRARLLPGPGRRALPAFKRTSTSWR